MADYHVGCGIAGIYAGTYKSDGVWRNKSDVTDEAVAATAQYLLDMNLKLRFRTGGKQYVMSVQEIKDGE